ncbi:MAG: hypothetical protein M5U14_08320 [Acidimicrobiia bacterium]|nr:hypothetical protein [Acidimicrobiia bacterium]
MGRDPSAAVEGLEARATRVGPERLLLALGGLLVLGGLALVGVAWWRTSETSALDEQMEYLVAGGLLGIVVATVGAVVWLRGSLARYLRYTLVRLVHEQREQTDRVVDALARLEDRIAALGPEPGTVEALDRIERLIGGRGARTAVPEEEAGAAGARAEEPGPRREVERPRAARLSGGHWPPRTAARP